MTMVAEPVIPPWCMALVHESRLDPMLQLQGGLLYTELGRRRHGGTQVQQSPPEIQAQVRGNELESYEAGLRSRGDVTIWLSQEAIEAWTPSPNGQRGAQRRYSDLAVQASLTLRMIFHLPLRQTEGFVGSLLRLMGLDVCAPDHTTLSRRHKDIHIPALSSKSNEPLHLIVDSTGLKTLGAGEWSTSCHGQKRRSWRKLHLGVNSKGEIIAQVLTEGEVDDATTLPDLMEQIESPLQRFTADGGYDRRSVYEAMDEAGTSDVVVVIPPGRRGVISDERSIGTWSQRNAALERIATVGRRDWNRESGYRQQSRVENTFLRYKRIFGSRLRSRTWSSQRYEVLLGCHVLNHMLDLGWPKSEAIAA